MRREMADESAAFLDLGDLMPALPPRVEDELSDVIEGIPCEVTDPLELAAIIRNLGEVPSNLVRVAAMYTTRQNEVEPAVLVLYPLRDCMNDYKKNQRAAAEPFPTMYWLASQELHERVSLLEGAGRVAAFTDRLVASSDYLHAMTNMHAEYAADRWALLTPADRSLVEKKRWVRALRDVGIAGIRNPASVKCLHTHYAHYLATHNNLIGQWVHEELEAAAIGMSRPTGEPRANASDGHTGDV
ncbi:hypothetical protein H310_11065 [Aphanomyces invadans]|uniref:DUF501 domain-containing protein n=1 Tax=Aphanomyces invadans TaxID=157072 RepID=A0A024TNQ5_9STRA|nr:hypothetical protein H310_11065 [Aphanomyces invadans]ETV95644.1 hypothetical protein H310_11065 [Aphanomyces invadans]RHY35000.1 hypothetical protein DYB32_000504 [Aphanomyces invadans]|eukprot:XP_008875837.1 hypothetical protein H310_11065 [Aphanomyces invadans]